jgi:chemotaxis signal transduction protein
LGFKLGEKVFAVAILATREIIEFSRPIPASMMPRHVRAVIDPRSPGN